MSRISIVSIILFLFVMACAALSPEITVEWSTYENAEYKFSIQHPEDLEVVPSEYGPFFSLGDQITIGITERNPLECRGDCPIVEKEESVTLAGQPATRVEGYLGSVGGFIPQQYVSYILERDDRYYRFVLYAISSGETYDPNDMVTIRPLKAGDLELFERIMNTLIFTN